jgi:hypothetical protein
VSDLKLSVPLRILGDEVRALKNYCAHGLVTQEEAAERLADWELFYPPGWADIEELVSARKYLMPSSERPLDLSEAAE